MLLAARTRIILEEEAEYVRSQPQEKVAHSALQRVTATNEVASASVPVIDRGTVQPTELSRIFGWRCEKR